MYVILRHVKNENKNRNAKNEEVNNKKRTVKIIGLIGLSVAVKDCSSDLKMPLKCQMLLDAVNFSNYVRSKLNISSILNIFKYNL